MDSRARDVHNAVKAYDRELIAQREQNGVIHIYRKPPGSASEIFFVMALTDNWSAQGKPVPWGLEVICARLRAMDLWKSETEVDRIQIAREKEAEISRKDFRNNIEAFLSEFRRGFAKATNDINTSSLSKYDKRALKQA
jgi:hypothetical protein